LKIAVASSRLEPATILLVEKCLDYYATAFPHSDNNDDGDNNSNNKKKIGAVAC
jgi:hypothetical protein